MPQWFIAELVTVMRLFRISPNEWMETDYWVRLLIWKHLTLENEAEESLSMLSRQIATGRQSLIFMRKKAQRVGE